MNHVNLIGKISSHPRVTELQDGKIIAQFTLSTTEKYVDAKGEQKKRTNWHRLSAWGSWVKFLENRGKPGVELAVEGRLVTRFYGKPGTRKVVTEVEINDLILL
jgi:single-strand DNA-binding protein